MTFRVHDTLQSGRILLFAASLMVMTAAQPAFEVASVRPNKLGGPSEKLGEREGLSVSPGSVTIRNMTLRACLRWAYDVKADQISGPAWLDAERYDILAKAATPVSGEQLRPMLQTLLEDRFKMTVHHEAKEQPVYALVPVKKGIKMRASTGSGESSMKPEGGALEFRNYSMPELAERLGARPLKIDRVVIDKTGLTGRFDFTIKFGENMRELKGALEGMERGSSEQALSIFTVFQEQLGLRLQPQKAAIDTLIVDHAEKIPTEN